MKAVWWCSNCEVPLLQPICERCGFVPERPIAKDLTPVFAEELRLLRGSLGLDGLPEPPEDFLLWASGTAYFQAGRKVASISGISVGRPMARLLGHIDRPNGPAIETVEAIRLANRTYLRRLEAEAVHFIQELLRVTGRTPVVPFSGGKDSLVVSLLARRAVPTTDLLHVFADTGIEAPDTLDFVRRFQKANAKVPFLRVVPNMDFAHACELLGPPSRIKRWCCSTQKAFPLGALYSALSTQAPVLSLCGVRRAESVARQKHERVLHSTKIADEIMISPIIDWSDAEVWSYLLTEGAEVNQAYRRGYRRVGCIHCPHNSGWSEYLNRVYYPDLVSEWDEFLKTYYSVHAAGIEASEVSRRWKARAGGLSPADDLASVQTLPCQTDAASFSVSCRRDLPEDLLQYLKPFGPVRVLRDDGLLLDAEVVDPTTNAPLIEVRATRPRGHIRFSVHSRNRRLLGQRITRQVKKALACVRCGVCQVTCPTGAISCSLHYIIDDSRCSHCLRCVTDITGGCVAAHATNVTGEARWNGDNRARAI